MQHVDVPEVADIQALIDKYDLAVVQPLAARVAALEGGTLPPPTTTYPSGVPITTDVPAGWRVTINEHFDLPCTEGGFAGIYPQRGIKFYPRTYFDTRYKQNRANGQTIRGGEYSADFISVAGSICRQRMFVRSNVVQCSALVPVALAGNGLGGDAPGMIWEERSRFTFTDGLKSAHLSWPRSNDSTPDGEIDYPEFQAAEKVDCFIHHQGATTGGDQKLITTTLDPRQWHTYRLVWKMGQSVTIYGDGIMLGTYTTKIPSTPMHLVLQNESWLDSRAVPATATGVVETDWIRVMVPV